MIYRELLDEIPTLSKTTLYNTLNLFVERGIINMLNLEENEIGMMPIFLCTLIFNVPIAAKSMTFILK